MEKGYQGTAELLKVFKYSYFKTVSPAEEAIVFSILIILVAIGIYYLKKYLTQQRDLKAAYLKKDYREKEKLTLKTLLANLKLLPHEYQLLNKISGSSAFNKNYKTIESVRHFEARVKYFKSIQNSEIILPQIYELRHKLGFHFKNPKASFICTQMLSIEDKLECSIQSGYKQVLFLSPIINITEKYIYIKPPTNKGKPVNLKRFAFLMCRVRREEEVFEFKLSIIQQIFTPKNHIVLSHSDQIRKIIEREFERIPVHLLSTLYILAGKQVNLNKKALRVLKESEELRYVDGNIADLSGGGLSFLTSGAVSFFHEKRVVLFEIPGLAPQMDLQAQIISVVPIKGKHEIHLKFFHLSDIERLKLNKFILKANKDASGSTLDTAHPSNN